MIPDGIGNNSLLDNEHEVHELVMPHLPFQTSGQVNLHNEGHTCVDCDFSHQSKDKAKNILFGLVTSANTSQYVTTHTDYDAKCQVQPGTLAVK